jgi:hypothetical protein
MKEIKIPTIVKDDFEYTGIQYKSEQLFMYDPDVFMHIEFMENGFIEHIPNSDCEFICDDNVAKFCGETYRYGEAVDVSSTSEDIILNLCELGIIKKVYKNELCDGEDGQEGTQNIKDALEYISSYLDLKKHLNYESFANFKNDVLEKCEIEISHHSSKVLEDDKLKIYEALK